MNLKFKNDKSNNTKHIIQHKQFYDILSMLIYECVAKRKQFQKSIFENKIARRTWPAIAMTNQYLKSILKTQKKKTCNFYPASRLGVLGPLAKIFCGSNANLRIRIHKHRHNSTTTNQKCYNLGFKPLSSGHSLAGTSACDIFKPRKGGSTVVS